jgi:galactitol-specific phosphotransferase system IIB component
MALTLLEASKLNSGDVYKSGVMMKFAETSDILRLLPFEGIAGNSLKYNVEETLPGIGFRGVNESFTESTGIINPKVESLTIAGGDLDVDKFIVDTMGQDQRAVQEAMKVKALALSWTKTFIKGDSESNPREFDGLQVRIKGNAVIENHASGAGLSLLKLDEAIDEVDGANIIIMSKSVRRRLTVAARTTAVGGDITYSLDEFGRQVTMYNGLPIIIADKDNENNDILGFTEAGSTTSIYVLAIGEGQVSGLQNGGMDVRDIGELENKPAYRTRIEWYSGMGVFAPRVATRLKNITDAAATV